MDFGTIVKNYWPVLVAVVAIIGAAYVADYRISEIETKQSEMKGEPLKLALLQSDVSRLKCEVQNVKRLLRSQPEQDC